MKIFDSPSSLDQVRNTPLYETIKELLGPIICPYADREYRPEEDGYLVLVEREDMDRVLLDLQLPYRLAEVPFEAVTKVNDAYYAIYVPTNSFSISFLVPSGQWITDELRTHLEENIDL